jgi:TonB family protein
MKYLICIFLLTTGFQARALELSGDTIWFKRENVESSRKQATFYRTYTKSEEGFIVNDRYMNGQLMMHTAASQLSPLLQEGHAVHYNENGSRRSQGSYHKGKQTGTWTLYFENEKDSSAYEILPNGTTSYKYRSPLQIEELLTIDETQAEYPGGLHKMMLFFAKNLQHPKKYRDNNIGGRTELKFVIDEQGLTNNIEVIVSSGVPELDEEAIRAVSSMPKWKPATVASRPVKCYFTLPLSFALDEPYFILNMRNPSDNYLLAKEAVLSKKLDKALEFYAKDPENIDTIYNMGVIYYLKKDHLKAKSYFEKVVARAGSKDILSKASKKFLEKTFK